MIELVEGFSYGVGDDAYIDAYEEAIGEYEMEYPELDAWLKENMDGKYSIEEEYDQDYIDVTCTLYLLLELETDKMAFKLAWK